MRKTPPAADELLDLVGSQIFTFHRASGAILDPQMCAAIHNVVTRSLWTSR